MDRSAITGDTNYWVGSQGWSTNYGWNNSFYTFGSCFMDHWSQDSGHPQGNVHAQGLQVVHYRNGSNVAYGFQLVSGGDTNPRMWTRKAWGGGGGTWYELALRNYNVGGDFYASLYYDSDDTGYYVNPAGNSQFSLIYANNWFRPQGQTGVYSPSYGIHFWAQSTTDWSMSFAGNTSGGLHLWKDHQSTTRIHLYYDTAGSGLLTNTGNWGVRMNYDGGASPGGTLYGNWTTSGFLVVADGGGYPYGTASTGIYFGSSAQAEYRIYTQIENVSGNYTKLTIDWHTGIRIGASTAYGGIRFYNNAVAAGGAKIFSVGEGDDNVRVRDYIYAQTFYDITDPSYFVNPNSVSRLNSLVTNSVYTGNKTSGAALSVTTTFQDIYDFSIAGVYIPAGVNRVVFWYNASARQYASSGLNHCAFRLRVVNDQTGAVTYIGHAAWGFGIMRQTDDAHHWWQYNQSVVLYPAWSDTGNAGGLTAGYSYTFYLQCKDIYDNAMFIGGENGGTFVGYSPVQGIIWVS